MAWQASSGAGHLREATRKETCLKKPVLTLAIIAAILVALAAIAYVKFIGPRALPAKVMSADNRDYFPVVHELFTGAQRSIDVIIYQGRFYFQYPLSRSNALITDLVDANERGVKVRAILEEAEWNFQNSEDNRDVWNVLSQAGVATYFDPLGTTSHSKLVVVDGEYTVMGSMNWSYYALDQNNEATVVVKSPQIAKQFEAYFDRLLRASSTAYGLPERYMKASEAPASKARLVFVKDVADSGRYLPETKQGLLYMGDVAVMVDEDALEEILAVDSLFFAGVAGDTVRVFGEVVPGGGRQLHALDLKTSSTLPAMVKAFGVERSRLKTMSVPKPALTWIDASRVVPIPNEKYVPEVTRLIRSAKQRVWVAMLDARYYDTRPVPPERDKKRRPKDAPPSLTNVILDDLAAAARRGVDVQVVCDAGRGSNVPNNKLAFMKRLQDAGGKVFWDSPEVTTHSKLVIVDNDFTVIGSTNWTQPAVEDNNETAVLIESPEINQHYAGFIASVKGLACDLRPIGAGVGGMPSP